MCSTFEIVKNLQSLGARWVKIDQRRLIGVPKTHIEKVFNLRIDWDSPFRLRPLAVNGATGFGLTEFYDCFVLNRPFFSIGENRWLILDAFGKEVSALPEKLQKLLFGGFDPVFEKSPPELQEIKKVKKKRTCKSLENMDFLFPEVLD